MSKRQGEPPRCERCGGPHPFDTDVESSLWNRVVRDGGHPDYLCLLCIVEIFTAARQPLTAWLYGPDMPQDQVLELS